MTESLEPPRRWRRVARLALPLAVLLLGSGYALVTVPFGVPDEFAHFWHAYNVSEGNAQPERGERGERRAMLPRRIVDMVETLVHARTVPLPDVHVDRAGWARAWRTGIHAEDRAMASFSNTGIYSPLLYLPSAAGIAIGRLLHASVLQVFYLARIGNVIAAALLLGFACRRMAFGRELLVVASLLPMSLFLFGSVSADAMVISLGFAWVAIVADFSRRERPPLSIVESIVAIIFAAALGQAKLSLPLAFLMLAPCLRRPLVDRRLWLTCLACLFAAIASAWFWMHVSDPLNIPVRTDIPVDPVAQVSWVRANPVSFLGVILKTLAQRGWDTCRQIVGVFGWLQTALPTWIYVGGWLALVVATAVSATAHLLPRALRVLCGLVVLGTIILTYYALYLTFTGVGAEIAEGIQGRYLIPLLLPLGLVFLNQALGRPAFARPAVAGVYAFILIANLSGIWVQFHAGFG